MWQLRVFKGNPTEIIFIDDCICYNTEWRGNSLIWRYSGKNHPDVKGPYFILKAAPVKLVHFGLLVTAGTGRLPPLLSPPSQCHWVMPKGISSITKGHQPFSLRAMHLHSRSTTSYENQCMERAGLISKVFSNSNIFYLKEDFYILRNISVMEKDCGACYGRILNPQNISHSSWASDIFKFS